MATVRQRSPGVWEVRVYAGRDAKGRPVQVSRIVHGSRRTAARAAADLTVADPSPGGARTAIIAGTDVRTVANRLGHSNPAMTLRIYAHAIAAADAGAADALGRVLGGGHPD
jgi:integrase